MPHGSSSPDCCPQHVSADDRVRRTFAPYSTRSSIYCAPAANGVCFRGNSQHGGRSIITSERGRMQAFGSVYSAPFTSDYGKEGGRSACPSVVIMELTEAGCPLIR